MTKLLVVGNSQAGPLKRAMDLWPQRFDHFASVSFFVTPGGCGPYVAVENGKMRATFVMKDLPPYWHPEEAATTPVSSYDAVLVSGLGYFDGGHAYINRASSLGLIHEFEPIPPPTREQPLVSKGCYFRMMQAVLSEHHGFQFARGLRSCFGGSIFVQPFPLHSDRFLEIEAWKLRDLYRKPLEMYRFLVNARDKILSDFCAQIGASLLSFPDPAWVQSGFTPRTFMPSKDDLHPGADYGALVLDQLQRAVLQMQEA